MPADELIPWISGAGARFAAERRRHERRVLPMAREVAVSSFGFERRAGFERRRTTLVLTKDAVEAIRTRFQPEEAA